MSEGTESVFDNFLRTASPNGLFARKLHGVDRDLVVDGRGHNSDVFRTKDGEHVVKYYNKNKAPVNISQLVSYQKLTNRAAELDLNSQEWFGPGTRVFVTPMLEVTKHPEGGFPVSVSKYVGGTRLDEAIDLVEDGYSASGISPESFPQIPGMVNRRIALSSYINKKLQSLAVKVIPQNVKVRLNNETNTIDFHITDLVPELEIF